jgi:hypothetical protein
LCYDEFLEKEAQHVALLAQRKVEMFVVEVGDLKLENIRHSKFVERMLKMKTTKDLLKIQGVVFLSLIRR